jgi:hypothetical protein
MPWQRCSRSREDNNLKALDVEKICDNEKAQHTFDTGEQGAI